MVIEVDDKAYRQQFPCSPQPYISEPFIEQVKSKVGLVVRLLDKPEITNWIDPGQFNGEFSCKYARMNYNQSLKYKLSFHRV
jgi:hypothetical protein